jgi:hypothetical protein
MSSTLKVGGDALDYRDVGMHSIGAEASENTPYPWNPHLQRAKVIHWQPRHMIKSWQIVTKTPIFLISASHPPLKKIENLASLNCGEVLGSRGMEKVIEFGSVWSRRSATAIRGSKPCSIGLVQAKNQRRNQCILMCYRTELDLSIPLLV